VAGTIVTINPPVAENDEPSIGPQHIIFTDHVDRTCIRLLRRAGGLITRQGGADSPSAIAAVELGLPAIIGVEGAISELVDGLKRDHQRQRRPGERVEKIERVRGILSG
jgi:phosphohistidine swiveling domain-containing protein